MKWCVISGGWKKANEELKSDVERTVEKILSSGKGIITGGALGVDFIATRTTLDSNVHPPERLRIYLPVPLVKYSDHLYKRVDENVITREHANMLTNQLAFIREAYPECIHDEWGFTEVNSESYYTRNTKEIEDGHELYAFHVNETLGTQDIINKARVLGKPIYVKKYSIR